MMEKSLTDENGGMAALVTGKMHKLWFGNGKTWALGIKLGSCVEREGNGLMTLSKTKLGKPR